MHPVLDNYPIDAKRYDKAVAVVRKTLGSYERIATDCYNHTGTRITGQAVRCWFLDRKIPIEYAAVFVDLTDGAVEVFDFFPWLEDYLPL